MLTITERIKIFPIVHGFLPASDIAFPSICRRHPTFYCFIRWDALERVLVFNEEHSTRNKKCLWDIWNGPVVRSHSRSINMTRLSPTKPKHRLCHVGTWCLIMTADCNHVDMDELFVLAQKEDWNTLAELLEHLQDRNILFALSPSRSVVLDEHGTVLHIVCSSSNVNKTVVEKLLQLAGPELLLVQDPLGHTALHDAFRSCAPLDVMELLVTSDSLKTKDNLCLTPLDHVCERIIMREERHRYDKNEENNTDMYLWECARMMLQAWGQKTPNNEEKCMMMHACIQASSSCPLALRQRVMKRYAHQLETQDSSGNLPLHIAAGNVVDEDEDLEVIQQVLEAFPAAIRIVNANGHLPLDKAIRAGRTWSSGAQLLFEAFPEALFVSENPIPPAHYAVVFEEIGRKGSVDAFYKMIKAQPELFRRRR